MAEIARLLARLPHGFPTPIALMKQESTAMQGFFDAGGGTRTPDTRIMIGALPLISAYVERSYRRFRMTCASHICRLGDHAGDQVSDWAATSSGVC